jgi:hypothetical protein
MSTKIEWCRKKWFWFSLYHPQMARFVYWLSLRHWKLVFIKWHFKHRKKYCWADLVMWSLGYQRWRDMSAPSKCGYCLSCMSKTEIEEGLDRD